MDNDKQTQPGQRSDRRPKRIDVSTVTLEMAEAFWANVLVGTPAECWPYVGAAVEGPYGHRRCWFNGRKEYAHRVSYALAAGETWDGEVLQHRCENGWCCNYLHLVSGSDLENARTRDSSGRHSAAIPRGAAHWSARLSWEEVRAIRAAHGHVKAEVLASLFGGGVSRRTIFNIWAQVTYPAWADPAAATEGPGEEHMMRKLASPPGRQSDRAA